MTLAAQEIAKRYWAYADAEPFGIGLRVSDPRTAKQQLYAARKAMAPKNTPADALPYRYIEIRTSPRNPTGELFMVKDLNRKREIDAQLAQDAAGFEDLLADVPDAGGSPCP